MKATEIEYRAHMRALYKMVEKVGWSFIQMCVLLDLMQQVRVARVHLKDAETREGEALARWSLQDKRNELIDFMLSWGLSQGEMENIWWLEQNT